MTLSTTRHVFGVGSTWIRNFRFGKTGWAVSVPSARPRSNRPRATKVSGTTVPATATRVRKSPQTAPASPRESHRKSSVPRPSPRATRTGTVSATRSPSKDTFGARAASTPWISRMRRSSA